MTNNNLKRLLDIPSWKCDLNVSSEKQELVCKYCNKYGKIAKDGMLTCCSVYETVRKFK